MADRSGSVNDDANFQGLVATIQGRLAREKRRYPGKRCIYRVPPLLRQTKEEIYTPVLVSIGPLHYHKDKKLLPMEADKLAYLDSFLRDTSRYNMDLNTYLRIVKDREAEIRECYAESIDLSSDDFVQMILIDSVFIIELFRRIFNPCSMEDDYIYGRPWMIETVIRDLLLEENQIPLFILTNLHRTAFRSISFTDIARHILNFGEISNIFLDDNMNEGRYCHLLDLVWHQFKPAETLTSNNNVKSNVGINKDHPLPIPTATQLYKAGVKFRVSENSSKLLDIKFDKKKGILTIPFLKIDDNTEHMFRNIMAFEQCHCPKTDLLHFTSYQYFLDWLIDTPNDVQLLIKEAIFENWLGSNKKVSNLINSLSKHTQLDRDFYIYSEVTQQLNTYYKKPWNNHKATLKQTYFSHPWAVISVVYAAVLLFLTLIQTMGPIKDMITKYKSG